jgi:hypothetical protein
MMAAVKVAALIGLFLVLLALSANREISTVLKLVGLLTITYGAMRGMERWSR